jgi:hypothetical protein
LLAKYQSKGVFTALLEAEPFTQIEKVRVENLMQEYKDKTEAAKLAASKKPAAPKVSELPATSPSGNLPSAAQATAGEAAKTSPKPVLADAPNANQSANNNGQHPPQL